MICKVAYLRSGVHFPAFPQGLGNGPLIARHSLGSKAHTAYNRALRGKSEEMGYNARKDHPHSKQREDDLRKGHFLYNEVGRMNLFPVVHPPNFSIVAFL